MVATTEAVPCAECGTTGGRFRPWTNERYRYDASRFGLEGLICWGCMDKLRQRSLDAKQVVAAPALLVSAGPLPTVTPPKRRKKRRRKVARAREAAASRSVRVSPPKRKAVLAPAPKPVLSRREQLRLDMLGLTRVIQGGRA